MFEKWHKRKKRLFQGISILVTISLLLGSLHVNYIHANSEDSKDSFDIGDNITAVIDQGSLHISGKGSTKDFNADTAPFKEYADEITSLVIDEGITHVGAYLFYGLGKLEGELILPESIESYGDYSFYGDSLENAAKFTKIQNNYKLDTSPNGNPTEITGQQIENPETLFYPGQNGQVDCAADNMSFIKATGLAGYQTPDVTNTETEQANLDIGNSENEEKPATTAEPAPKSEANEITPNEDSIYQVYVASSTGDDNNSGKFDEPVKSLKKASEILHKKNSTGTVETNQIIFKENYTFVKPAANVTDIDFSSSDYTSVAATIKGISPNIKLTNDTGVKDNHDLNIILGADIRFDNIKLENTGHIYANGHKLETTENVGGSGVYLYCGGRADINKGVGKLIVNGGSFARIVGYIRSTPELNANNELAEITVGGKASVSTIISGSASGSVTNANVKINIEGGTITSVVGGCQGFNNQPSKYTGKTEINISGGTVTSVFGGGTGRSVSIPTSLANININILGGSVGDIYGSGSAGYIISEGGNTSNLNISTTGGTINNIYTAGIGGDDSVGKYEDANNNLNNEYMKDKPNIAAKMGSFSGNATIKIGNNTLITGNIYGSGKGYTPKTDSNQYDTKSNAYVSGKVDIEVSDTAVVKGDIYAGGKGITGDAYDQCARVETGSIVDIKVSGGTIEGNVYGGGEDAEIDGTSSITVSNGIVKKNIYGGGKQGIVKNRTSVNIQNGTINGSVYGGARGIAKGYSAYKGTTVNMTGGWIRGNLYGGSELSNDGTIDADPQNLPDLIFVNLAGGTVSGRVFGGSYQGTVNGSTHLHIGLHAMDKCKYYQGHVSEIPNLNVSKLTIGGSIYAGGDYGGDGTNYDTITVNGYSHVYIDGTDYVFNDHTQNGNKMTISAGVFGSGASCDAGQTRLVTLDNFGEAIYENNELSTATTFTSIQRADQVRIIKSHIRLTGQSDVANTNQTALYSVNRIGGKEKTELGALEDALVLQGGSTLMLDSASIELAKYKSVDANENVVSLTDVNTTPNKIKLTTGTIFRVSTSKGNDQVYGGVYGYTQVMASDNSRAYAYARKNEAPNTGDGGFVSPDNLNTALSFQNESTYRYWIVNGKSTGTTTTTADTVLTAQKLEGNIVDGYATAKAILELPPVQNESTYKITGLDIPSSISLINDAKNDKKNWANNTPAEQNKIKNSPLDTFGLYMCMGEGFKTDPNDNEGKVISNNKDIIDKITQPVTGNMESLPQVEFYLTYDNDGITKSQDLGKVAITVERYEGDVKQETIIMNVEIVTKATALSAQTVDLYATQSGSYTGKLIIPSGSSRTLSLTGVNKNSTNLVNAGSTLSDKKVSITMQPEQGEGWGSADLMATAYDLSKFTTNSSVLIGTTDSRYEASIDFVLNNVKDFTSDNADNTVVLTLTDSDKNKVDITLQIHWKKSIVNSLEKHTGKIYEDFTDSAVQISSRSALTTAFQLDTTNENKSTIWLELQSGTGKGKTCIPTETEFTLWTDGKKFYSYKVTGTETDKKITLNQFKEMWTSTTFNEDLSGKSVTVVMDLDESVGLIPGDYSLRLRSESTADSIGADFTVDSSVGTVKLISEKGSSTDQYIEYKLNLDITDYQDTRLSEKYAVVLSSADAGIDFPESTVFVHNGKTHSTIDGKVYLMLGEDKSHTISMRIPITSTGDNDINHNIEAKVFGVGVNAGSNYYSASGSYSIEKKAKYAIDVKLKESKRIVKPKQILKFDVDYGIENVDSPAADIKVEVQKKSGSTYQSLDSQWIVTGQNSIPVQMNGKTEISVQIPEINDLGTYRILFTLGDQKVPFNIVIDK